MRGSCVKLREAAQGRERTIDGSVAVRLLLHSWLLTCSHKHRIKSLLSFRSTPLRRRTIPFSISRHVGHG